MYFARKNGVRRFEKAWSQKTQIETLAHTYSLAPHLDPAVYSSWLAPEKLRKLQERIKAINSQSTFTAPSGALARANAKTNRATLMMVPDAPDKEQVITVFANASEVNSR